MTNNLHIFGAIILTGGINVVVNFKPGESKEEIKKAKNLARVPYSEICIDLKIGWRSKVLLTFLTLAFYLLQLSWCQIELLSCTAKVFSVLLKQMKMLFAKLINFCLSSILFYFHLPLRICLVPVRRFPSPYRSIHFGDVSEANWRETPRQKQNEHACNAFWNLKTYVNVVSRRRFWVFFNIPCGSNPKGSNSPSSHENYLKSILGSQSYCVVILRTPPYWSVKVTSCNFKLGE